MKKDSSQIEITGAFYRDAPTNYHTPPHIHEVWQWYHVVHGDVRQTVNDAAWDLSGGTGLLLPPGAERSPACSGHAPGYFMILFQPGPLQLLPLTGQYLRVPGELQSSLDQLVSELREPRDGHARLVIHTLVTHVLIGLLRTVNRGQIRHQTAHGLSRLNTTSQRQLVQQAVAYMQGNLHDPLTREDIAAAVHCSAPHFARLFKKHIGTTPGQYVTHLRIDRAKQFLLTSNLSVTQIAYEVGFQSFSHFTQLFRRSTGVSPSVFRTTD